METIKINCPECNHTMEYWTINNHIICTKCKTTIEVEPCKEELTEEELTEEENEQPYNPTHFYAFVGGITFDNATPQEVTRWS